MTEPFDAEVENDLEPPTCARRGAPGHVDRIRALSERKSHRLSIVGDDLCTALDAMVLAAQMIEGAQDPTYMRRLAARISREGLETSARLERFLDFAVLEFGAIPAEPEHVCLRNLCEQALERYTLRAWAKGVELGLGSPASPVEVWADSRFAMQIVDNLVSNALAFSPVGANVALWIEPGEATTRLRAVDQGPGLTEKDLEGLINPFAKLSPRPTGGERCRGLGLFIVKHLAEAVGGSFRMDCGPDRRTTFCVDLPRRPHTAKPKR